MPNPLNVPITPPRVAFIDPRTGNVSREWYMFFLSLFTLSGGSSVSLDDLQKGPPALTVDEINALVDTIGENLRPSTESVVEQIAELRKQIESLEVQVRPELGTMSQLQQDNVPWLQFDTTPSGMPTGANANGTLYWDDADGIKTLNLVMEDSGGVVQQIGEETYYRIKADAAITNGQVVMFTGTVGASGGLKGAPATGLTAFQNEYIMGVATQDIALNSWGYVTWFGLVRGINTTGGAEAWVDGQILYYNPAVPGGLTKNVPTAPNPKVIVASVVHAASNGSLFVRPTFGSALGVTDSNVEISGLANGDLLQYDGVQQRWENVPASTLPVGTATNLAGGAAGSVPYQSAPSTTAMLPIGAAGRWLGSSGALPQWNAPAALTKTDDTNITLTLGGNASTALLNAASLTLGWTGELSTTRGGTGLNAYTAGDIVYYASGTALSKLPIGATNTVLTSSGAAPQWSTGLALTSASSIDANSASAALRVTQTGAGNALVVEDSTSPDSTPFVVDANGIVVTGYTTSQVIAGATYQFQMNTAAPWVGVRWNAASTGPTALLAKSRSATIGTNSIVSSGDAVGALAFAGDDGTQFVQAASISAAVDGTPGTNDMPGRLVFNTTADGASSPTARVRIDSAGYTHQLTAPVLPYQGAITTKNAAATLTGAELVTGILNTTGTTYTITLPTGTNIEGALVWAGNNVCLDWWVINTASGTITIAANGNTTLGGLTIGAGVSAYFRIRRTATNTFTVYRLS